jgi:hypothetical protein
MRLYLATVLVLISTAFLDAAGWVLPAAKAVYVHGVALGYKQAFGDVEANEAELQKRRNG